MNANSINSDASEPTAAARLVDAQMADLARLRAIGMGIAEELDRQSSGIGKAHGFAAVRGAIVSFARVSRSIRQIIVLEQEIIGLREGPAAKNRDALRRATEHLASAIRRGAAGYPNPDSMNDYADPDDYNDYDDYDRGPVDEITARLERELDKVAARLGVEVEPADSSSPSSPDTSFPRRRESSSSFGTEIHLDSRPARNAPSCVTQTAAFGGGGNDGKRATRPPYGHDPP